jgi:tetratricopeptide (TPR) repeat protein
VSVLEDMARAGGDGDAVGLRQYIGRVCLALGDGHRAWDHFKQAEEALGAAAETTLAVHLCRGNLSLALGRHEDAYNHFARAVALDPTSMPARNNQAVAAVYLGRLTEGIAILKQAVCGWRLCLGCRRVHV